MPTYTHPRVLAAENRRFLRELAATGNVREAARRIGRAYATMQHRRKTSMALAQRWDACLALAQARLHAGGGHHRPAAAAASAHRTAGGEGVVIRRNDGRLQFRRAQPNKLTRACEQAFLLALSATCNVKLAAAAAGAAEAAFYRRKRRDKGFAREWLLALEEGYARLEIALLATVDRDSHEHDGWSHNERPEMPPMTVSQALQLMYLHQKEARLQAEPPHVKRRRGESVDAHRERLLAMREASLERGRDQFRIAEAVRHARGEPTFLPWEPPVTLPDLAQVTGWSKADPAKTAHDDTRALFGGWRIGDMKGKG